MNLRDFTILYKSKDWKRFDYVWENQPWRSCSDSLKAELIFTRIVLSFVPPQSSICFLGTEPKRDSLRMDFVTSVDVDCESFQFADILTIFCKDGKKYVIVAME